MSNQNLPTMADLRDYYETLVGDMTDHLLWEEMTPSIVASIAMKYIRETTDLDHDEESKLFLPILKWVESFYEEGEFALCASSKRRLKRELQNGGGW